MDYLRNDVAPETIAQRDNTDPRRPRRRILSVADRWIFDQQRRRLRVLRDVAEAPSKTA